MSRSAELTVDREAVTDVRLLHRSTKTAEMPASTRS